MTRIYIVRHCEAQGNREGRFQGSIDSGISENGIMQLKFLSERFKNIPVDSIYSSPLKRAVFTADAINKYHGLNVKLRDDLREIDGGEFEGVKWKELPALYPEKSNLWINKPHLFATEKGESMKTVYTRAEGAVKDILLKEEGRTVAVVTHGCLIRCLMCFAKGIPFSDINKVNWCDNTGINLIEFDGTGKPSVMFENDINHLSGELLKYSKKFM